jgi:hypothetical protein
MNQSSGCPFLPAHPDFFVDNCAQQQLNESVLGLDLGSGWEIAVNSFDQERVCLGKM